MVLDSHFLLQKSFREHHLYQEGGEYISEIELPNLPMPILFKAKEGCFCVQISPFRKLQTQYYVGVDWIVDKSKAIYVEPKLNHTDKQTDYLKMLFSALSLPEASEHSSDLYEIKWDKTPIAIKQDQDLLTPLLVVIYLNLVKEIVRKGLKKSYYRVKNNLYSRVKGKVIVGKTIKENTLKNKTLHTWCSYDEFGFNGPENRLLKKALVYIKRYLPTIKNLKADNYTTEVFNYINPAFESISEDVNLHDILHTKNNAFYKEYTEAIRLAKLILQRFGYNITNASRQTVSTPPFWIDMTMLFEFYILGQLNDTGKVAKYQSQGYYGQPDYLIKKEKVIVDAKYKTYYRELYSKMAKWEKDQLADDVRQLSGYGRDLKIRKFLDINDDAHPSLVIIYPNQAVPNKIEKADLLGQSVAIAEFHKTYKLSIDLPTI